MSYQVFARKYRPQTFAEVVGQDHITRTLQNAIEQKRLAHAYLFVGPRGTGKTSTARIFAKSLNCEHGPTLEPCGKCVNCVEIAGGRSLNVLEFDAASNTQVDKVREIIIETVKYAPTGGRYKIYIVDEVHMLSSASFNALLKTLEEPPSHVIFMFATTEVNKVPLTILSRCQRFDMRRIPAPLIAGQLLAIAKNENIALEETAAFTVAKGAEGGMRDAESMLDQLVAFCGDKISEQDVLTVFGFTGLETVSSLCGHIISGDTPGALAVVHEQAEAGKDLSRLLGDLIVHLRNLLVAKADPETVRAEVGEEPFAALAQQADALPMERLLELIEQFAAAEGRMKWAPDKKMHFEVAVIKAIQTLGQATLSEILDTVSSIRDGGNPPMATPHVATALRAVGGAPAQQAVRPAPKPAAPKAEPVAPRKSLSAALAESLGEKEKTASPAPQPAAPAPAPAPAKSVVAEKPAEKPAAAVPVTISNDDLWTGLVQALRVQRPLAASYLEHGALVGIEGDKLIVGFPPEDAFTCENISRPNHRKLIDQIVAELTGRTLFFTPEIRAGIAPQRVASSEPPPAAAPADPMAEFKNDPLIQKALEIFRGEIQAV